MLRRSVAQTVAVDDCCGSPAPDEHLGVDRYDAVFDARFAQRMARRYTKHGPSEPERRMLAYLTDEVGVVGLRVLEIGGGVGELQLALLARGAASTENLELSSAYESQAARLANEAGVADRVTRRVGLDLAEHPDAVDPADIVLLHRVVCCYPDADRLLAAAADAARRALVFTHPPVTPLTRLSVTAGNLMMRLIGRSYRGYVHSPETMIDVLSRHGLRTELRERDGAWCVVAARR